MLRTDEFGSAIFTVSTGTVSMIELTLAEFSGNECNQVVDRIEIVGNYIFVVDCDLEMVLQISNEGKNAEGIDHVSQKGAAVPKVFRVAREERSTRKLRMSRSMSAVCMNEFTSAMGITPPRRVLAQPVWKRDYLRPLV